MIVTLNNETMFKCLFLMNNGVIYLVENNSKEPKRKIVKTIKDQKRLAGLDFEDGLYANKIIIRIIYGTVWKISSKNSYWDLYVWKNLF